MVAARGFIVVAPWPLPENEHYEVALTICPGVLQISITVADPKA
jgi:hypothetical protein